ncbi:hypothetical protein RZS08_19620, partial [Arthrospira platensis SPKY1]|nr:hypothetical protein [Arthrospira platensis SPKY1]
MSGTSGARPTWLPGCANPRYALGHGNRFRRIRVGRAWLARSVASDDGKGGRRPPDPATRYALTRRTV